MLKHIALNIVEPREVFEFYIDILGFVEERRFILEKDISAKIFKIDHSAGVFLLNNKSLVLELFVIGENNNNSYAHLCLEVENRDIIIQKAQEKGYPVTLIKRSPEDMVFVSDKTGNLFELKQLK